MVRLLGVTTSCVCSIHAGSHTVYPCAAGPTLFEEHLRLLLVDVRLCGLGVNAFAACCSCAEATIPMGRQEPTQANGDGIYRHQLNAMYMSCTCPTTRTQQGRAPLLSVICWGTAGVPDYWLLALRCQGLAVGSACAPRTQTRAVGAELLLTSSSHEADGSAMRAGFL